MKSILTSLFRHLIIITRGDAKVTKEIVRSGLRLTKDLNHDLARIAHEIGMTKNQLMVKILYDWVKEQKKAS